MIGMPTNNEPVVAHGEKSKFFIFNAETCYDMVCQWLSPRKVVGFLFLKKDTKLLLTGLKCHKKAHKIEARILNSVIKSILIL